MAIPTLCCRKAPIDLLCIDETKLDASFPDAQSHVEGYQYPYLGETVTNMGVEK